MSCVRDSTKTFKCFDNSQWRSVYFEEEVVRYQNRLKEVQADPVRFKLIPGENLHIWKRFNQLIGMSPEELRKEIEADHAIFHRMFDNMTDAQWADLDIRYGRIETTLQAIGKDPSLIHLVPGEDLHIWARLKEHVEMPLEILMQEFEADHVLLFECL